MIHAMAASMQPIETAFEQLCPTVVRHNILDDRLPTALADPQSRDRLGDRFIALVGYAAAAGTDAVLFTCSAFGPYIRRAGRAFPAIPVLRPNEGLVEEAAAHGGRIGLVATFAPTLASMPAEFPATLEVRPIYVEGALEALNAGDGDRHDRLIAEAVGRADVDVAAIAQFSAARAAGPVRDFTGKPVLTTPDSAVRKLIQALSTSSSPH
ncbi:MAG: arylsulfatase [Allosphingosinicella sp.]|uniref:arylsulfatase n=1 Tax=Allosphingosinicella sp. TaxID=2823234 RepID=UPI003922F803